MGLTRQQPTRCTALLVMKTLVLTALFLAAFVAARAGEIADLAPGVAYPRLAGPWVPAKPELKAAAVTLAEVTPGHFYVLQPVKGRPATAVYHTPQPSTLAEALKKPNGAAFHLVAELPLTEARFAKEAGTWVILGQRRTEKNGAKTEQYAPLRWQETEEVKISPRKEGKLRVAVFDDYGSFGQGIPRCVELLGQDDGVLVTKVKPALIRQGGLANFDVVVFTGGSGGKQAATLGLLGREQVRRYVEAGGGYIGICAGNYLACDGFSWGLHILDAKTKSSKWARGVGDVNIEFTQQGRDILAMPDGEQIIRYANGPVFAPAGSETIPDYETLAWFRSELAENGSPKGAQTDSPAMVSGRYGKGRVLCSSPHPEQQPGMESFIRKAVHWAAAR